MFANIHETGIGFGKTAVSGLEAESYFPAQELELHSLDENQES